VRRTSEVVGLKRGDFRGGAAQEIGFTSIMFRLKANSGPGFLFLSPELYWK
jgi:hypothetical protein